MKLLTGKTKRKEAYCGEVVVRRGFKDRVYISLGDSNRVEMNYNEVTELICYLSSALLAQNCEAMRNEN